MEWWTTLTPTQRRILIAMGAALILIIALFGWTVYTTGRVASPPLSLTPSPTSTPVSPTAIPTATSMPPLDIAAAGHLAREVARARRLVPRWETPLTLVNEHELSVILYQRYRRQPPFPLSHTTILKAVGLYHGTPPTPDPVAQARAAAALFNADEGTIEWRRDWKGSPAQEHLHLAYAYALALTEQYAGLEHWRAGDLSLDQQLALEAFAHGEALYTLHRYLDEPLSALTPTLAPALLPTWREVAPEATSLAHLPLRLGVHFATHAAEPLLDDALRERPPRSTAQLLHPQDYSPTHPFYPFEPLEVALPASWTMTETETMGEALMRELLNAWGDPIAAENLRGWDGDLLQLWEDGEGGYAVLWQTAWMSGPDALAFASTMRKLLPRHIRGLVRDRTLAAGVPAGDWWATSQGAAYLRRYADQVWVIWGTNAPVVEQIAGSLP